MVSRTAFLAAAAFVVAAFATPAVAQAAEGVATSSGTMRAGPGSDYPAVDHISSGDSLEIYGCTDGYSWCDVSVGDNRGWFSGSRLAFVRNGHRQIIRDVGASLGIAIIGFGAAEYWDQHYRSRPFYNQERRFDNRRVGPGQAPHVNQQPRTPPVVNNTPRNPRVQTTPRVQPHVQTTPHVQSTPHVQTTPHAPAAPRVTPHAPAAPSTCHAKGCVVQ